MILLGIDPSLTGTALTFYNTNSNQYQHHLIKSERTKNTKCPSIDNTRRIKNICNSIDNFMTKEKPNYIIIEGLAYGAKGRAVMTLGGLSHMIREVFLSKEIPFIIIPPKTLKKYWTGSGNANKTMMIEEAVKRDVDITIMKNYGTKKLPHMLLDDNIVDSFALVSFLEEYLDGKLPDYEGVIEKSWEL